MGSSASQAPTQTLDILVQGEALAHINSGQVLANGSSWHPIRVLDAPVPPILPVERSLRRPGVLDWLHRRLKDGEAEPLLQAEAVIPMAVAAQVCAVLEGTSDESYVGCLMQLMATIDSCLAALLGFSLVTLLRFAMPLAEHFLGFQVYSSTLRLHPLCAYH